MGTAMAGSSSTVVTAVPRPVTAPAPAQPATVACDEATTKLLAAELAKYIGPIAGMLVRKSLAKSGSRQALIAMLEEEISEEADRSAFRRAIQSIPAFAG
jgi:hypothetical protein